jgi:hypothetical protein
VQEIVQALGYTEIANLRRAFKRWEGHRRLFAKVRARRVMLYKIARFYPSKNRP